MTEYHQEYLCTFSPKAQDKPDKLEFSYGSYTYNKRFIQFELMPHITFIKDSQMDEGFETEDRIIFGYKSYSIIFSWLFFYCEISLNFITDKWMKNENN